MSFSLPLVFPFEQVAELSAWVTLFFAKINYFSKLKRSDFSKTYKTEKL